MRKGATQYEDITAAGVASHCIRSLDVTGSKDVQVSVVDKSNTIKNNTDTLVCSSL